MNFLYFKKLSAGKSESLLIKLSKNDIYLMIDVRQYHFTFKTVNDSFFERLFYRIIYRLLVIFFFLEPKI